MLHFFFKVVQTMKYQFSRKLGKIMPFLTKLKLQKIAKITAAVKLKFRSKKKNIQNCLQKFFSIFFYELKKKLLKIVYKIFFRFFYQ